MSEKLHAMAAEMRRLQTEKDVLEISLKAINGQLDDIRLRQIPEAMAEMDIRTVTFDGIGRVQLAMDVYATMIDKEAAYAWLADNGFDGLIQPYVQPSTFKAAVKEAIRLGQEFPLDLFKITPFTRASIVKTQS